MIVSTFDYLLSNLMHWGQMVDPDQRAEALNLWKISSESIQVRGLKFVILPWDTLYNYDLQKTGSGESRRKFAQIFASVKS